MNSLKKYIACLLALGFIPSPKATAGAWSYGIKAGGGTFFQKLSEIEEKYIEQHWATASSRIWNPSFGGTLYVDYNFNDYIGLGTALLYNRFSSSVRTVLEDMSLITSTNTDTIGFPWLLSLHWTAFIGPDFKEDYFLGRLFGGMYPFYIIRQESTFKDKKGGAALTFKDKKGGAALMHQKTSFKLNQKPKLGCMFGSSLEFQNGFLLEIKCIFFNKCNKSLHLSAGYNFAKLRT